MSSPRFLVANGALSVSTTILDVSEAYPEEGGPTATVTFQCRWGDRYALAKALRGGVSVLHGAIAYAAPYRYPTSPNLRCLDIGGIVGKKEVTDQVTGWLLYELAVVTANFRVPTYGTDAGDTSDPSGKPWTTTSINASAEVIVPPAGSYFFADGTKVPDSGLGLLVPQCEVAMKRHWMPYLALAEVMGAIGGVNATPVEVGNYTFARGQLLFANGPSAQDVATDGNVATDLEYKFLGRGDDEDGNPIDWNMLLSKGGTWQLVNTAKDGSGRYPFRYVELNDLP